MADNAQESLSLWSPRVERLPDAPDSGARFKVHHPGREPVTYRESWRPSWGKPKSQWPESITLDDAHPRPTTSRSKRPGGIWREGEKSKPIKEEART